MSCGKRYIYCMSYTHISPKDGQRKRCANPATCKFKSSPHFNDATGKRFDAGVIKTAGDVFARVDAIEYLSKGTSGTGGNIYGIASYDEWPVPQADDLDKIGSVVDSINAEADTPEAIGDAIGVGDRNGSYYANAAGYLGYVEKHTDYNGFTRYGLTTLGEQFLAMDENDRAVALASSVEHSPLVQSARAGENVEEEISKSGATGGYSDAVARRRAQTISSWIRSVDNRGQLQQKMSSSRASTIMRSVEAAEKQREMLAKKKAEMKPQQKQQETCPVCFTIKSLDGSCWC